MKFLILAQLFLWSSGAFAAGSWTSGGGGTGIACFTTVEAATEVRRGADLNSRPDLVEKLDSVLLTDIWENNSNFYVEPLAGETPNDYVERVVADRLKTTVPLFYARVEKALAQVRAGWSLRTQVLPASHDTGEIEQWPADTTSGRRTGGDASPLEAECAQVQIALRQTISGRGESATVSVAVNSILYSHLGIGTDDTKVNNQAALLLHEALYMIAQTLGHKTSFDARRLTAALLSNTKIAALRSFENYFQSQNPVDVTPERTAISNELNFDGFGAAKPGKGASAIAVGVAGFQAAEKKMNEEVVGADDAKARALMLNFPKQLTPAESFAAVGNTALGRGLIPDLETLADADAPGHAEAISAVCALARAQIRSSEGDSEQIAAVKAAFIKAKSFCKSQKLAY